MRYSCRSLLAVGERAVSALGAERFSTVWLVGFVFAMGVARALIEYRLFGEPLGHPAALAHQALFFVTMFLAGGLLFSALGRARFQATLNAMFVLWPITLLTPLIDAYVFGSSQPYGYLPVESLYAGTFGVRSAGGAEPMLLAQLLMFCAAGACLVYLTSGSVRRAAIAGAAVPALVLLSGAPGLVAPWLDPAESLGFFGSSQAVNSAFVLYYSAASLVLLAVGAWRDTGAPFAELRFAFRPWPTIVYGTILLLAYALGLRQSGTDLTRGIAVDVALLVIGWVLTWQTVAMTNDAWDADIDAVSHPRRPVVAGWVGRAEYLDFAVLLAAWAFLLIAMVAPLAAAIVVAGAVVLGNAYSAPPLAVKRRLFGPSLVMGLAAGIVALGGFFAAHGRLDTRLVVLGVVLVAVFALGVVSKDAQDASGDEQAGARTLFTVLGYDRGRAVASGLVFASALLPAVVVQGPFAVATCVALAGLVAFVFWRSASMTLVFPLYFAEMVFVGSRILG